MSTLLETMVPLFGLMALGYASARVRLVDEGGVRGLVTFVFTFAIPALLLDSVATLEVPGDVAWGFLLAFYVGSFVTWGLGLAVGAFAFGRGRAEQAIFGLGGAFSNLVLIGLPVVLTVLGPEASFPMVLIIGFHSATFMPLTVVLIQSERSEGGTRSARLGGILLDTVRNPIVASLIAGFLLNVGGLGVPGPLAPILELLGAAAVPCALFALGGSLAQYATAGAGGPSIALAALKLVVHPMLVWLIAVPVLGLDGIAVSVAVLMAAMPSAVFVYLFGARYGAAADVAARTVFVTSVGSFVTLSVVVSLLTG